MKLKHNRREAADVPYRHHVAPNAAATPLAGVDTIIVPHTSPLEVRQGQPAIRGQEADRARAGGPVVVTEGICDDVDGGADGGGDPDRA